MMAVSAKLVSFLIMTSVLLVLLTGDKGCAAFGAMPVYQAQTASYDNQKATWPTADGTFLQWWLVQDWDDDAWARELQALREAGMEYLVLAPTAFHEGDENNGTGILRTIFPVQGKGYETMLRADGSEYPDVVDACLRNARQYGFKVFLGLNFSDEWWSRQYSREWLIDKIQDGNELADELWERYHREYEGTFFGWYWCWEVSNSFWRGLDLFNTKEVLASALRMQIRYLEDTDKRLPMMISPFMNRRHGSPSAYASMWKYVFAHSGLRRGDIFCPQDSVGAGGLAMDDLPAWFAELREAVDTLPGLQLWADTETFDITDWTGAPIGRFIEQMKAVSAYVDNHITFAYSHYYSPNIVHNGFHETYLEYVATGHVDNTPPASPAAFTASRGKDGKVHLSWMRTGDEHGICGYHMYRDGIKIANLQVPRASNGTEPVEAVTFMVDRNVKTGKVYRYQIMAYDFTGNVSPAAGPVVVALRRKP